MTKTKSTKFLLLHWKGEGQLKSGAVEGEYDKTDWAYGSIADNINVQYISIK